MVRTMRRQQSLVDDEDTLRRWLDEALVGRLATIDENGYPIIKPVNFAYAEGKIYFHGATEGEKLDDIRRNARVGFEIDRAFALVPPVEHACQSHCFFESVVIRGKARILDGAADKARKEQALRSIVAKYYPSLAGLPVPDADKTSVVEITVDHISGKMDFGQRWPLERRLAVARTLLERDGKAAEETILRMGLTMDQVREGV